MNMKGSLENIMKQAQQMQEKMEKAQQDLANTIVIGQAGAGMVKVHMNCVYEVKKTEIDDTALDEDKSFLEDLVSAAINDAVKKVGEASRGAMAKITAGLNLPKDFQFPGAGGAGV